MTFLISGRSMKNGFFVLVTDFNFLQHSKGPVSKYGGGCPKKIKIVLYGTAQHSLTIFVNLG